MSATANQQMSGNSQAVELNNLGDIMAEQLALANETAVDPTQVQPAQVQPAQAPVVQQPKPPETTEELTPAAKQAAEAAKAEEGNDTFDFGKFLEQKNRSEKVTPTETKPQATSAQTTPTPVKTTEATTQQTQQARDLTGIAPEHHDHFKRMSNESFNALKAMYTEHAQLKQQLAEKAKGGLPDSYYEHEQAYVLTPEFASESTKVTEAETIYNHYAQQANAIANGSKTYNIIQRDAQGQLIQSAPLAVDRATATQVQRAEQQAYTQLLQAQANLNAVGNVHRQRAAESKAWLNDFEAKAFPVFSQKPELKTMVQDTVRQALHKSYHNNPLAPLFAKALLVLAEQGKMLQTKAATSMTTQGQNTTTQSKPSSAQPSAAEIAGGGAAPANGKQEVTMDMFSAAKKGLL